jgi:hypothetical protein
MNVGENIGIIPAGLMSSNRKWHIATITVVHKDRFTAGNRTFMRSSGKEVGSHLGKYRAVWCSEAEAIEHNRLLAIRQQDQAVKDELFNKFNKIKESLWSGFCQLDMVGQSNVIAGLLDFMEENSPVFDSQLKYLK